jgi:predicted nucleotidyltransferase component of viral defense system
MKDYLLSLTTAAANPTQARNIAREYLQARILNVLQRISAMIPLAFHGGTALRFLYTIPRYSEDLDFALERPTAGYDFRNYLREIQSEFASEGYRVELRVSDKRTVQSAFVRFVGLLYELALSPHRDEVFAVKLEVDTNPPTGAVTATTVIRRHVTLHLQHHDKASLLAGKLHAILQRPYAKGRDLYDLLWYLSDPGWPPPNLLMLNHALRQTSPQHPLLSEQDWRPAIRTRLESLDWVRVQADVAPFLERPDEIRLLTRENFLHFL